MCWLAKNTDTNGVRPRWCCHTPTLACDPMLQLLGLTCIGWRDEMVGFSLKKWDGRAADEWVHINKKVEYMLNCVKYRLDSKLIFRWLSLTINHAYWTSYKHKSCKPANWKQLVTLCYFSHVPFLQLKVACRLMLPHLMLPAAARKKLQEKRGCRGTGHTAACPSDRVTCHMHMWSTGLQTTVLPSRLEKKYKPRDVPAWRWNSNAALWSPLVEDNRYLTENTCGDIRVCG
jgi:hypothetical protein